MVLGRNSSIRYSLQSRCEQKGCYRFLNNKKVTEQSLITELINKCKSLSNDRDLIVIQDTSSFNLNNHYYRLKKGSGLGTIEDNFNLGFFLHASLVIDAYFRAMSPVRDIAINNNIFDTFRKCQPNEQYHTTVEFSLLLLLAIDGYPC
jgi:hypothetical protein